MNLSTLLLRRRMMMQGSELIIPYVTPKDLLFYLDFHDYIGGDIREQIRGILFKNNSVIAGENCAEFMNGSYMTANANIDLQNANTFEIVVELSSAKGNIFSPHKENYGLPLGFSFSSNGPFAGGANNYTYISGDNTQNVYVLKNGKQVISARTSEVQQKITRNYVALNRRTRNNSQYIIPNTIGGNGFFGKIMCIRYYSRELTDAEILENQQIDNQRFNLGL